MSNGWQLHFEAQKPNRVHRYFWSATVMDGQEPALWWCGELNKFLPSDHPALKIHSHGSHSKPIRTLRAFKRFLKEHPELQGRRVILVNRFVGFDVEAQYRNGDPVYAKDR